MFLADHSSSLPLLDTILARISLPDHAQFGQGFQHLGDGFFWFALEVSCQGGGIHGRGFELVADGADLGLQGFGPGLFFGAGTRVWCGMTGSWGGVFVAGGEF